jgi:hypothetical protein
MKYIMGALGVIFLVILVVVLITRGGGRGPTERPLVVSEQAREGVSAVMTQQGRLVGEDQRRAIRIVVSQDERRIEILTGYDEAIERAHSYPNTPAAFVSFLAALQQADFIDKKVSTVKDVRGACPFGRTFIYEVNEFSQSLFESWGTTCSRAVGTAAGDQKDIRRLFQNQIDDYSLQIRGVSLTGSNKPEDQND